MFLVILEVPVASVRVVMSCHLTCVVRWALAGLGDALRPGPVFGFVWIIEFPLRARLLTGTANELGEQGCSNFAEGQRADVKDCQDHQDASIQKQKPKEE